MKKIQLYEINRQWHTAAKSLQSCPTLCDPIDSSPSGSSVPGILKARTLEWVAISLSNTWKWKVKGKSLSRIRLLATPWTAAHQAPPSMGVSRQEYWSGVPVPSPNGILFVVIFCMYEVTFLWDARDKITDLLNVFQLFNCMIWIASN